MITEDDLPAQKKRTLSRIRVGASLEDRRTKKRYCVYANAGDCLVLGRTVVLGRLAGWKHRTPSGGFVPLRRRFNLRLFDVVWDKNDEGHIVASDKLTRGRVLLLQTITITSLSGWEVC